MFQIVFLKKRNLTYDISFAMYFLLVVIQILSVLIYFGVPSGDRFPTGF